MAYGVRGLLVVYGAAMGICAAPQVSFNGYLDADIWGDMTGRYYANSELDLGMALKFSEDVSAHVYATVWSANGSTPGGIPARYAPPDERWLPVLFDGFDVTYATPIGTFTAGDLVYQYGKFNYYYYKRLSMITPESFTRGLRYSVGGKTVTQELLIGIADRNGSTADVQGVTSFALGISQSLGIYYGMKNDALTGFSEGTGMYAGAEYRGGIGEFLSIKADAGYMSPPGDDERTHLVSLLLEPVLTIGRFSAAFTGFLMLDGDSLYNSASLLDLGDEMFFYVEPGYSIGDHLTAGLPLEYHAADLSNDDDNAFWVVPTLYVYPFKDVQWWIWGQVVKYMSGGTKNDYGFGSEIIVSF